MRSGCFDQNNDVEADEKKDDGVEGDGVVKVGESPIEGAIGAHAGSEAEKAKAEENWVPVRSQLAKMGEGGKKKELEIIPMIN